MACGLGLPDAEDCAARPLEPGSRRTARAERPVARARARFRVAAHCALSNTTRQASTCVEVVLRRARQGRGASVPRPAHRRLACPRVRHRREMPPMPAKEEDLLDWIDALAAAPTDNHAEVRLRIVAALEGYRELPRGGELRPGGRTSRCRGAGPTRCASAGLPPRPITAVRVLASGRKPCQASQARAMTNVSRSRRVSLQGRGCLLKRQGISVTSVIRSDSPAPASGRAGSLAEHAP